MHQSSKTMQVKPIINPTPLCKNLWTMILLQLNPKDVIKMVLQINKELKRFLGIKLDWTNHFIKRWYPHFYETSLSWWSNHYIRINHPEYKKLTEEKRPFVRFWRLVREEHECEFGMPEYGTCDDPKQLAVKFPKYRGIVHFTKIHREKVKKTERRSGWRWHKWGAYFGDHDIEDIEYLNEADGKDGRPLIDLQYSFSRYRPSYITYKYKHGTCKEIDE